MSLFDCNHLVHVIVLWQMQKFMCHFTVFALFILNSRATSKYQPRGLVFGGTIYRRQEPYVTSLGGSYLLGLSLGILRYLNNWIIYLLIYLFLKVSQESLRCGAIMASLSRLRRDVELFSLQSYVELILNLPHSVWFVA